MANDTQASVADDQTTGLGTGFWAAWSAAMLVISAAFSAAIWWLKPLTNDWPGLLAAGAAVIAFTGALLGVATLPQRMRRKRGLEGRLREPYKRYTRRFLPAMIAYVVLIMAATAYAKQAEPSGPILFLLGLAPSLPVLLAIRAITLLPREEDDEYLRDRIYRSYTWASGATLAICTVWGFLDSFDAVPPVEMWVVFPIWAAAMGVARCLPLGDAR